MCSSTSYWNYNSVLRVRVRNEGFYVLTIIMPTPSALEDFVADKNVLFDPFRCPHLTDEYSIAIPVYDGILTLIVLASFANASLKDPGIIPRGKVQPYFA